MSKGFVSRNVLDRYSTLYFLQRPERWKEYVLRRLFPEKKIVVLARRLPLNPAKHSCVIAWGTRLYCARYHRQLQKLTVLWRLPLIRMESGFFNSVSLGAAGNVPFSVCLDDLGIYYDATCPSRLENLLESTELLPSDLERSQACIRYILRHGISKINCLPHCTSGDLYGPKHAKRILVTGQVADDESIVRGFLGRKITCNDLVRRAREENPGAEIIYRIHPEVLTHYRKGTDPAEVAGICKLLTTPCSIDSALKSIDRIYTISSLVGFEGILRGIPVVCFGTPFYSGWGLTDDRDSLCLRRKRRLTIEALFYVAAMVYPDYFDEKVRRISFEAVLEKLAAVSIGRNISKTARSSFCPGIRLLTRGIFHGAKNCLRIRSRAAGLRLFLSSHFLDKCYNFWKTLYPSDIAYLKAHKLMIHFIHQVNRHTPLRVHFINQGAEHVPYRKIIIPNGLWPYLRPDVEKIPVEKRVYMEMAFFPQDGNVYFDLQGVHGYSSIRNAVLKPLSASEKEELESFRKYYTSHNFVKYAQGCLAEFPPDSGRGKYDFAFILVVLQSEQDTAFRLCPFSDNQEIIDFIESCFPEKRLIFRTHPDDTRLYRIGNSNILLPPGNTDLRELLLRASHVIACNSTVLLEALMHRKTCASLGIGFSTNHHVCLECHDDRRKILGLPAWRPDWDKVDRFLYYLLQKQIRMDFWKIPQERSKLLAQLRQCGLIQAN